ncbi:MAG: gliding motility-associated C-terminal domain-containing protein [Mucilaginibacter polytrichastri]|nr:gliding motility-associated C-terminal domain-containing protein [Mucilaginibacter polytrichastri]
MAPSRAQQCTGDLGEPVFIETFNSGSDVHGPGLAPGFTQYTFTNQDEPPEGSYTIARTTPVMGTLWWVTRDHTEDPGGYMMIVNARQAATGILYTARVNGLCPGTTFEASAWVMNLLRDADNSPPSLSIRVKNLQGAILGELGTGLIPRESRAIWKKFGLFFQAPADGSDVIIEIRNLTPGSTPGNDFALDDIAFRPCSPQIIAAIGTLQQSARVICTAAEETLDLQCSTPSTFSSAVYQWEVSTGNGWENIPGATSSNISVVFKNQVVGTYLYRVRISDPAKSASCGGTSNLVKITVVGKPSPEAKSNGPVCRGSAIRLSCEGPPGDGYEWTGPGGFHSTEQNPVIPDAGMNHAGTYTVKVTSAASCTGISQAHVAVINVPLVHAGDDVTLCQGNKVMLHATGGGNYTWSPAAGLSDVHSANPMASPEQTTIYKVTSVTGDCVTTDEIKITVLKTASGTAGPDKSILRGRSVVLDGTISSPVSTFYWSPALYLDDVHSLHPRCTATADMTYVLHIISENGCDVAVDEMKVRVFDNLVFRNSFTPNGDGINDEWRIEGLESFPEALIRVFNRYGAIVYQSRGYGTPWNGTRNGQFLPTGVYYYSIELDPGKAAYQGSITLIR